MHDLDASKIYNSRCELPLFAVQSNVKLTDQKSSNRIQVGRVKKGQPKLSMIIGHFRVPPGLCIKTRLGAQPLIWK